MKSLKSNVNAGTIGRNARNTAKRYIFPPKILVHQYDQERLFYYFVIRISKVLATKYHTVEFTKYIQTFSTTSDNTYVREFYTRLFCISAGPGKTMSKGVHSKKNIIYTVTL